MGIVVHQCKDDLLRWEHHIEKIIMIRASEFPEPHVVWNYWFQESMTLHGCCGDSSMFGSNRGCKRRWGKAEVVKM